MNLIFHTQYYPPEMGAPQNRIFELCFSLAKLGHHITVLTAMPNYPTGKIFPGYGGLVRCEWDGPIRVLRTAIFPTQKVTFFLRLFNYFSFVISSLLIGGWYIQQADYLITESPPLFLGIGGYILSRWKRAKWIFNVSDLWPESAVRLGIVREGMALKLGRELESFCYRKAWVVTGQSQTILEDIRHRFSGVRTFHLSNGANHEMFAPDKACETIRREMGDGVIVLYAGLLGIAQGLDQILFAAEKLKDFNEIKFIFMGDGPVRPDLISMAGRLHLGNVRFLKSVLKEKMPAWVASADICIVPLKLFLPGAVPSKIYETMASEKPVILVAKGEAADIVIKNQAGLVVEPGDIEGLVAAIHSLADDPELRKKLGKNGRKAVVEYFNRQKIVDQFAAFSGRECQSIISI